MEQVDNFTDRLSTHDLDKLMNDAWANLGEEGQTALVDDCFAMLKKRYPGKDELVLYNQAKDMARNQSDRRLYDLAVQMNMPKGKLDYLMRKITDMNLAMSIGKGIAVNRVGKTGDMAAYEEANENYRQDGHKILGIAGTVAGFALDPVTWLSGGVGGAAGKGAISLGGRFIAGKGASAAVRNAVTREFATSMTGRVLGGVVGGSANFGTYEGIKEMENQFVHGGHVTGRDESGQFINEGYSASAVAQQALHGAMMGASIGWIGPVFGNVSDKLVKGGGEFMGKTMPAINSTAGKVATRAGMYAGATVLEGTIFSVPEWIENAGLEDGDPNKRSGWDIWDDNMAMMVGFKAQHMLKNAGGVLMDLNIMLPKKRTGLERKIVTKKNVMQTWATTQENNMIRSSRPRWLLKL